MLVGCLNDFLNDFNLPLLYSLLLNSMILSLNTYTHHVLTKLCGKSLMWWRFCGKTRCNTSWNDENTPRIDLMHNVSFLAPFANSRSNLRSVQTIEWENGLDSIKTQKNANYFSLKNLKIVRFSCPLRNAKRTRSHTWSFSKIRQKVKICEKAKINTSAHRALV